MSSIAGVLSSTKPRPVASWRHTMSILAVFVLIVLAGVLFQHRGGVPPSAHHPNVVPLYLQLLVMEWSLFFFVWKRGLKTTGTTLRDLIGGRWTSPGALAVDILLAFQLLGTWKLVAILASRVMGPSHAASIEAYLPRGLLESSLWVVLSLSAGFCEELVFRGYFQRQFAAWTGRPWLAVVLQGVLFGGLHGYQGVESSVKIVGFGILYGAVALGTRNLRPGMMAHAATDILSGIFRV